MCGTCDVFANSSFHTHLPALMLYPLECTTNQRVTTQVRPTIQTTMVVPVEDFRKYGGNSRRSGEGGRIFPKRNESKKK